MGRRTLDIVLTAGGVLMTVVFLVAGSLLMWGATFTKGTVHDQLAAQQIFMPAEGNAQLANPEIGPYLNQYVGQQLVNGDQAEAYADHFIAVHLQKVANGQTYAQVSTKAQANPTDATLKGQAATLFQGESLRGVLLTAYAFWTAGQIAMWASIGAFVAAGLMLVLVILGTMHTRRVSTVIEVVGPPQAIAS